MRQIRLKLTVSGALAVLAFAGAPGASATVAAPCAKHSKQLKRANAELAALEQERHGTRGSARAGLTHRISEEKVRIRRSKRKLNACIDSLTQAGTPTLRASCVLKDAGPGEDEGDCAAYLDSGDRRSAPRDLPGNPAGITGIRVVLPGGRMVTNYVCPVLLPDAQIATTDATNAILVCSGGVLPVGTKAAPTMFQFNVRMTPAPKPDMGAQLFVAYHGTQLGPFAITGP
jgi:hypothetical protein